MILTTQTKRIMYKEIVESFVEEAMAKVEKSNLVKCLDRVFTQVQIDIAFEMYKIGALDGLVNVGKNSMTNLDISGEKG